MWLSAARGIIRGPRADPEQNLRHVRKELLRKEASRRLLRYLGFVLTVELALSLLLFLGMIWLFAQTVEAVTDGESRRFDEVALHINANCPA